MEFLILPQRAAEKAVELNPGKLNVISVEKDVSVDSELCKNHIQIKCDDLTDWQIERFNKELKEKGMIYPEDTHIQQALDFDKKCNHKIHIIHCHAGVSRSPAIGYAVLRGRGWGKNEAMAEIKKIAPYSEPNERIIRLTNELLR